MKFRIIYNGKEYIGQTRGDWEDAVSSESYDQCLASLERIAREQGESVVEVIKEWEQ